MSFRLNIYYYCTIRAFGWQCPVSVMTLVHIYICCIGRFILFKIINPILTSLEGFFMNHTHLGQMGTFGLQVLGNFSEYRVSCFLVIADDFLILVEGLKSVLTKTRQ